MRVSPILSGEGFEMAAEVFRVSAGFEQRVSAEIGRGAQGLRRD
jgi:hypothetical protein